MNDTSQGLRQVLDGHVLRLTLDRPEAANSLDGALTSALERCFLDVRDQPQVRAIVLTGAGDRFFCPGADLKADQSYRLENRAPTAPFARLLRALRAVEVPVVARVNGTAAGGGVGLLGLCDFVIAAERARLAITEINIGLFPTQVVAALQRVLPRAQLVRLCMLGEPISAAQAQAIGLVTEVVPAEGLDTAVERLVEKLVAKAPAAMRRGKYLLRAIESMGFEESLCLTETMLRAQSGDPDAREGMAAFREKRAPNWT